MKNCFICKQEIENLKNARKTKRWYYHKQCLFRILIEK